MQLYTTDGLLEVNRMKLIAGYMNIAALAPERGQQDFARLCDVLTNFVREMQTHINPTIMSQTLKTYPNPLARWLLGQEMSDGYHQTNRRLVRADHMSPGETLQQHAKGLHKWTPSTHVAVCCKMNDKVLDGSVPR